MPAAGETVQVVPSAGLPAETPPSYSNNNLDVVRHDGRVYLAWRTGESHFAGPDVVMNVVSSTDEKTWRFETQIKLGTDVREPRFLSWDGRLFLYFAILGKEASRFEPQGARVIEKTAAGWSAPAPILDGAAYIAWRTKVVGGKPYMVAYLGGENIYNGEHDPIYVNWLTTTDGRAWSGVVPSQPVVHTGGASETDFVLQDDGSVIAVLRDEAGDEDGWGSKLCRAAASTPATWQCQIDPRKFDSPLLFRHGAAIYLIARRNVTESGNYDLMMRDLSFEDQTLQYLASYSLAPKRCALWKVDPATLRVDFVLDLPSKGDTCFPAILDEGDDVIVYNYSSSIEPGQPDIPWIAGQLSPTFIYRTVLTGL